MKKTLSIILMIIFIFINTNEVFSYKKIGYLDVANSVPFPIKTSGMSSIDEVRESIEKISDKYYKDTNKSSSDPQGNLNKAYDTIKVTVTKDKNKYYLGKGSNKVEYTGKENMLFIDENKNKDSWEVFMDIEMATNNTVGQNAIGGCTAYIRLSYFNAEGEQEFDPKKDAWETLNNKSDDFAEGVVETVGDVIDTVKDAIDWVANFLSNPLGTFVSLICDFFNGLFDAIQTIINMIQTASSGISDFKLMYSNEELQQNTDGIDAYTKISSYGGEKSKSYNSQKPIGISQEDGEKFGFDEETEIPVIPVELYSMAAGKIDFFNINILKTEKSKSSLWNHVRNFAAIIIHIVIYIASAVLLIMLMWHGINIVKGSITPKARIEHREGISRLAQSIVMLIGTIVIMALIIYFNDMVLDEMKIQDIKEGPMRVNVKSAGYSFSTTPVGYVRYMAGIEEVDEWGQKMRFSIAYWIIVILNLILSLIMIVRMFIMMFFGVLGPVISVFYALNHSELAPMKYRTWVRWYISIASFQILLSVCLKIFLNTAFV